MALMAGHTNGMIYDENLVSFLVDNKVGVPLVVWKAFCFNGTTDIVFLNGQQCSGYYQDVLKCNLLPIRNILGGENCKFQQGHAPIHTSYSTTNRFARKQVNVID